MNQSILSNILIYVSKSCRKIHCIPATSAAVERQFSSAGFVLNERRISINPDYLDNILFIRTMEKNIMKRLFNLLEIFLLYLYMYCFVLNNIFSALVLLLQL